MSKVAIFGAGYTVKPMVDYFIDRCNMKLLLRQEQFQKQKK